eukprot:746001-Hanusia_phi.AAC.2
MASRERAGESGGWPSLALLTCTLSPQHRSVLGSSRSLDHGARCLSEELEHAGAGPVVLLRRQLTTGLGGPMLANACTGEEDSRRMSRGMGGGEARGGDGNIRILTGLSAKWFGFHERNLPTASVIFFLIFLEKPCSPPSTEVRRGGEGKEEAGGLLTLLATGGSLHQCTCIILHRHDAQGMRPSRACRFDDQSTHRTTISSSSSSCSPWTDMDGLLLCPSALETHGLSGSHPCHQHPQRYRLRAGGSSGCGGASHPRLCRRAGWGSMSPLIFSPIADMLRSRDERWPVWIMQISQTGSFIAQLGLTSSLAPKMFTCSHALAGFVDWLT